MSGGWAQRHSTRLRSDGVRGAINGWPSRTENTSRDLRGDERDPERGLPQGRVRRTAVDRQLRGECAPITPRRLETFPLNGIGALPIRRAQHTLRRFRDLK
jgi:hypothetical protein